RGVGENLNIAKGKCYSLLDLSAVIEDIVGRRLEGRHHPMRRGDVRKTYADISKARKLLGYKPVMGLEPGLRDTWDYFVERYFRGRKTAVAA
ncbi:MAG: LPS biosynthesis protein WbpP, partial [Elusimicrobia bacterium]|nr:LPS biosynthesis protein WbpP [Elusimicrobiota bacterium]